MIETRGLTKHYGAVVALHPLELDVGAGEVFGYVGPNGAGKTTTIRLLCGLLLPTGGTARVAGADISSDPDALRSAVGYMPDTLSPYEGMRVWEYLDFFAAAYRLKRKDRRQRIDAVLESSGAREIRDYFVETLSHGMRQRLGLARTLVHDPQVLLLDEPTNGLDPRARVEMRVLLNQLKDAGKTILISSHILPELANVCDRIGFMERGELVACGTLEEVQRQVRPYRLLELQVTTDPAACETELRELLGEGLHEVRRVEGLLHVQLQGQDDDLTQLLADLVAKGHRVIGFREVLTDLEEAFLTLTASHAFGERSTVDS